MNHKTKKSGLLMSAHVMLMLTAMFFFSPQNAIAQEVDPQAKEVALDEVIISATRTPELKRLSATTVTIVSGKRLEEMKKVNADLTSILGLLVPGMAPATNTTSNRSQTLRGRQVSVLIDGIPQSTPLRLTDRDIRSIDPEAVERIEIVKGATSIYGYGASGGLINIITKKHHSNKAVSGKTTLGFTNHSNPFSKDRKYFSQDAGMGYQVGQLITGKVEQFDYVVNGSFRQSGVAIDGDGLVINPRYGLGQVKTFNGFTKLGYSFGEKQRLELMYNYYQSLQSSDYITSKEGVYLEKPSTGIKGAREGDKEGTKYNHNLYLQYTHKDVFSNTDLTAAVYHQNLYTIFDYRKANTKKPRWEGTSGQATIKAHKIGARLHLNTRAIWSENFFSSFTYGLDILRDNTKQPLTDGRMWVPEMISTNIAPYLQTRHTFMENNVLKVGLRYDFLDVAVADYATLGLKKPNSGIQVSGGHLKYNRATFNVGFVNSSIREFQPYVSFSQGFSIYDLGRILRDARASKIEDIQTDPVVTNNYEVGFNSQIGHKLTISGSLFRSTSKLGSDLVSKDGFWVPLRAPQYINGFELSADLQMCKYASIGGSYSMQEGKVDNSNDGTYGKYMSGLLIAPSKLTLYTNLSFSDKLALGLYYTHTGTRDRFVKGGKKGVYEEGEGPVFANNLFNLNATYNINKSFNINVAVENLFNATYYTTSAMVNARDKEYTHGNGCYYTISASYKF